MNGVERLLFFRFVRWCNGNTAPFGGVIHGSNPCRTAIIPNEIAGSGAADTVLTQETAESESANVKYPKRIKHRGRVLATIHAHYKGLATKAEAEKWFNVLPPKSAKNVILLSAAKNA